MFVWSGVGVVVGFVFGMNNVVLVDVKLILLNIEVVFVLCLSKCYCLNLEVFFMCNREYFVCDSK